MSALIPRFIEILRTSFWFVPALMGIGAVLAALVFLGIDERLDDSAREGLWIVYSGGAEGARQVLSTIAGSMITVAGVVFSITIVALSLASQQFGPRLLRNFMDDRGNQVVLGTFTALFVYCILVLRTIQGENGDSRAVVPHLSITVAVVLAIVAVAVLIYFIHHVSLSIQADAIVARVAAELEQTTRHAFAAREESGETRQGREVPAGKEWRNVGAPEDGYIQAVGVPRLVREAKRRNCVVELRHAPGEFVHRGMILARVSPPDAAATCGWLLHNVVIGRLRTPAQDPEFSVSRLAEVALRALSPSLNDPYTAISCIDRLTAGFAFAAGRPLKSGRFADLDGTTRLTVPLTSLERLAAAAFHEVRQAAVPYPSVSIHLLSNFAQILRTTQNDEARRILLYHARLVREGLESEDLDPVDREAIEARYADVLDAGGEGTTREGPGRERAASPPPRARERGEGAGGRVT